jgi:D-alanyl-D-alanine carboxypeptidase
MLSRVSRTSTIVLFLTAFAGISFGQTNEAGFKKLDGYFADLIAKKRSPAISVAVVEKGHVVYSKGFGLANLEQDVEANASTVYRIGSITKQFTATMIMQLVQEGKLSIDDSIEKVLPEMPKAWSKVTVKNLLNHTSGIKSYTELKGMMEKDAMQPTTPLGIIKKVENEPMDFEPGTKWHYNNTGYELLGILIEKLDKRTFAESLKTRILSPLGMNHTYFVSERSIVRYRAQGYSFGKNGYEHAQYLNMDWPYAAGSIESTVLDLAKWDEALYGEKILPKDLLAKMWEPTVLADGTIQNYGFGWGTDKFNGQLLVEHGGGIHGFTTQIRRVPSKGMTVIILTNTDGPSNPAAIANEVMGLMDPSLKVSEPKIEVDKNPSATKEAQAVLQSVLDGKFDRSNLTPEFGKVLTPELLIEAKTSLNSLGPVTKFEFLREAKINGLTSRMYNVRFASIELKLAIATDSKGKIGGLEIRQ